MGALDAGIDHAAAVLILQRFNARVTHAHTHACFTWYGACCLGYGGSSVGESFCKH